MTASPVTLSSDQLHFHKLAVVVFDVFPDAIRAAFEYMWNTLVATRPDLLNWDDSLQVRKQFLAEERGKTKYVRIDKSYKEWDCTALFEATLFAQSFAIPHGSKHTLYKKYVKPCDLPPDEFHPTLISPSGDQAQTYALALDQLRRLRNYLCHQNSTKKIPKANFDLIMQRCKDAIHALGQSVSKIEEIEKLSENDFPSVRRRQLEEELKKVLKKEDDIMAKVDDVGSDVKSMKAEVLGMTTKVEDVASDVKSIKAGLDDNRSILRDLVELFSCKSASTTEQNPEVQCEYPAGQYTSAGTSVEYYDIKGSNYYDQGNYEQAILAFQTASGMRILDPNGETKDSAWSLGNLGAAQLRAGDLDGALKTLQKALGIARRHSADDDKTAAILIFLGCVHFMLKNYKSAFETFQVAADIRSNLIGEHEDTACTYLWLGVVHMCIGDLDNALKSLQESSRLCQKLKTNSEPSSTRFPYLAEADTYHLLGVVYLRMGDLSKALVFFQKESQLKNTILGEHIDTATSLSFLGSVCMEMGDSHSAVEAFLIAANMTTNLLGRDKITAFTYYCLGKAQRQLGDLLEASISLQIAADMRSNVPNGFDEETARYFNTLGLVQLDIKNWEGALESFKKAAHMRMDLLGDHQETASSYHNLGQVQAYIPDNEGALLSLKKAASISAKLHDETEIAACTYNNLGIVQLRMGDLNGALESLQKASQLNDELLREHPYTASTFHNLGFVLLEIGDYHNEAALQAFKKAAHIRSHLPGVPVKDKACTYHKLGVAQLRTGDLRGALKSLQEAADIGSEFVDPINIASNCYWLGLVQLDLGMDKEALCSLKKTVDFRSNLMGESRDEETANTYHNLGVAQMRLNDFKALESLRIAANTFFYLFGDDKRTACSYHELGAMQLRKGDLIGALESVNEAFRMRKKLLGNYHRNTTESLSLIHQINRERRRYHLGKENRGRSSSRS